MWNILDGFIALGLSQFEDEDDVQCQHLEGSLGELSTHLPVISHRSMHQSFLALSEKVNPQRNVVVLFAIRMSKTTSEEGPGSSGAAQILSYNHYYASVFIFSVLFQN